MPGTTPQENHLMKLTGKHLGKRLMRKMKAIIKSSYAEKQNKDTKLSLAPHHEVIFANK